MKICSCCSAKKAIECFTRDRSRKDGRAPRCRGCNLRAGQKWRAQLTPEEKAEIRAQARLRRSLNPEQYRRNEKIWTHSNPDRMRAARRRRRFRKYGLTESAYQVMRSQQDDKCAVCQKDFERDKRGWDTCHIDHDHETGKVRGLLCSRCNVALGDFQDSEAVLTRAIEYLRKHKQKTKIES